MIRWFEAEPVRLKYELASMTEVAPEMSWLTTESGRFTGLVPIWPFERERPSGLAEFLNGRRLDLDVVFREGFPMVAPRLVPVDPVPSRSRRLREKWHLNADGTLCLLFSHAAWSGREPAAELVRKAAGWFIEYLLVDAEKLDSMTVLGPAVDDSVDQHLAKFA